MAPRVSLTKSVASALTIGSGGSAGREGPIIQIGASIGSTVAQLLRLSEENVKLLLASGAAGGIAATFNAPIAGVFFALEVILRRFNTRNFSVVVLASVVATVTAVSFRGDDPTILILDVGLEHVVEILFYALLGVLAGVISVAFIRLLYWTGDQFSALPYPPVVLLPALGGLMVGLLALIDDGILGTSSEALRDLLTEETVVRSALLLLMLKVVATSITIGSGGSGGVFSPSLFAGAALGAAYGGIIHALLPDLTAGANAYATVGMAALVAGTARSPITAVLIIFELTRDYAIILPVMTASVLATFVSQTLSEYNIFTLRLAREGVLIEEEQLPINVMQSLRVSDAMRPAMLSVAPDAPVEDIARALAGDHEAVALVVDEDGKLYGIITDTDVNMAIVEGTANLVASDICTPDPMTIFPDQSLHEALGVFAGRSMHALPVTLRDPPETPAGVLRRADITNAYASWIDDRDAAGRRGRLSTATRSDNVRYLELRVTPASRLSGRQLIDVPLTEDAVIVAVRRGGVTLIPRGHTQLIAGDRVTLIATESSVEDVRALFEGVRSDDEG
jgi:CIC family chloride channel protein